MGIMNPNSTNYQHSWEPNLSDLHTAMDYLPSGEPALRVISTFQGNIVVQGDITISSNIAISSMPPVDINSMPEVSVFTDSGNVLAVQGTVYQGTNPWVISGNSNPNALGNEIFVKLTNDVVTVNLNNECLSVQNCEGTRLNTNSNSIIMINELPVGGLNPFPVNVTNTCLSVQNCGTDGVLNVSGAITVEGVEVTIENPFPVDLRNNCIGVENCEGTVLNVAGNISILSGEDPVSLLNPLPVNLTNECLSVQNCTGTRLNVNSNSIILLNELPVGGLNPFPVNITNTCLSVQNCGPDGVLNVSGAITVEGVEVTVETPFPVDLRNECLSVQNCAGTQLSVKLSDGVNNIGFVVNDNDGQSPGTYSVPVENFNMVWNGASWDRMPGNAISGVAVNITNGCLSVANCAESVLAIAGDVNVQIGGVDVSADNPVPVTIPNCVSIQNCGESTLGINGTVGLEYDGQVVNESHPLPISKNSTPNSSANPINVTLTPAPDAGINSSIDSKGRLKVQTQQTIFFNTFQYGKETDVWDESTANGGTATFDSTVSQVRMAVTNQAGSKVIRQTRNVQRYTPGRTQTVAFAVRLQTPVTGIRRRLGMFDGNDGFFFEDCGTVDANGQPQYACVIINSDGVTPTVERIYRSDWNGDKLDGNGPSGIVADPRAQQLIMVDYEWYGAGSVTFSFVINGLPRVIHTVNNGNRLQSPWCKTPFLPIRLELENLTGVAGTHYMWQGSNSILAEGSVEKLGIAESILTPLAGINMPSSNTFYPIVSLRLKSTALTGIVLPTFFQASTVDNTDIYYKLIRNATVNGTWVDHPDTNAFTQYNYTSTGAITDGVDLASGIITSGGGFAPVRVDSDTVYQIGRGSLGTVSDTITLAIAAKNANKNAVASMTWIEQR